VQVVNFAEHVLQLLKVVAPGDVLFGQKVLYDVPETLQADAQRVKRDVRAIAQSVAMEFVSFGPTFQSEMFEERAAGAHSGGAARQGCDPFSPLLAIEFLQGNCCLLL